MRRRDVKLPSSPPVVSEEVVDVFVIAKALSQRLHYSYGYQSDGDDEEPMLDDKLLFPGDMGEKRTE